MDEHTRIVLEGLKSLWQDRQLEVITEGRHITQDANLRDMLATSAVGKALGIHECIRDIERLLARDGEDEQREPIELVTRQAQRQEEGR